MIECPVCGVKVNDASERGQECGGNPQLPRDEALAELAAREEENTGALFRARRLGGTRGELSTEELRLVFTATSVSFGEDRCDTVPMSDVRSVELVAEEQAKNKVGAVLLVGVLGGLAAKDRRQVTYLTVHMKSGDEVYYLIRNKSHMDVLVALAPVLKEAGVPFKEDLDDALVQPGQFSAAEEIGRYFDLLERGAITEHEYGQAKERLLGSKPADWK